MNRINLDDTNCTPQVVVNNKNAKILWLFLGIAVVCVVVAAIVLSNNSREGSSKKLDPNRTVEHCELYGTASVFGSSHINGTHCIPDGDGWYNPAFGHHHHK